MGPRRHQAVAVVVASQPVWGRVSCFVSALSFLFKTNNKRGSSGVLGWGVRGHCPPRLVSLGSCLMGPEWAVLLPPSWPCRAGEGAGAPLGSRAGFCGHPSCPRWHGVHAQEGNPGLGGMGWDARPSPEPWARTPTLRQP